MKKSFQQTNESTSGIKLPGYWTFLRRATPRRPDPFPNGSVKTSSITEVDNASTFLPNLSVNFDVKNGHPNGTTHSEKLEEKVSNDSVSSDVNIDKENIKEPLTVNSYAPDRLLDKEKDVPNNNSDACEFDSTTLYNEEKRSTAQTKKTEDSIPYNNTTLNSSKKQPSDPNDSAQPENTNNIPNGSINSKVIGTSKSKNLDLTNQEIANNNIPEKSTNEDIIIFSNIQKDSNILSEKEKQKKDTQSNKQTENAKPVRISWTTRLIQKLTEEEERKNKKQQQKIVYKPEKPKRVVRFPEIKPKPTEKREWPKFYPGIKKPQIETPKKEPVSGIKLDTKEKDAYAYLITQLAVPGESKPKPIKEKDEAHLQKVEEIRAALAREECDTSSDEDSVVDMKEKPSGIRRLLPQHLFSSKKEENERPVMEPLLKRGDRVYPARPLHETAFLSRSQSSSPAGRYVQENAHNSSRSKSVSPARDRRPIPQLPPQPPPPKDAYYHSPPSRRKASAGSTSSSSTLVADTWVNLEHQAISCSPDIRRIQQQRQQVPSGRVSAPPYITTPEPPRSSRRSSSQSPRQRNNSFQPVAPVPAQVKIPASSHDANCKETQTAKSYIQQCQKHHPESLHRQHPAHQRSASPADSLHKQYQSVPFQKKHSPSQIPRSQSPAEPLQKEYQKRTLPNNDDLSPADAAQRQYYALPENFKHKVQLQQTFSPTGSLPGHYQKISVQNKHSSPQFQYSLSPASSPQRRNQDMPAENTHPNRSISPVDPQHRLYQGTPIQKHSPSHLQRSLSPSDPLHRQYQNSPAQLKQSNQQLNRSLSPADSLHRQYQLTPAQIKQSTQQFNRSLSPADSLHRQQIPAQLKQSPQQLSRSLSPADSLHKQYQNTPAQMKQSPSQLQRSLSPSNSPHNQYHGSPAQMKQIPQQLDRSLSPADSLHRQYQNVPAHIKQCPPERSRTASPADSLHRQHQNTQSQGKQNISPPEAQQRQYQNILMHGGQYRKLSRQEVEALYWETQKLRAGLSSLTEQLTNDPRPPYRVQSVQNIGSGYGSLIVKPQPVRAPRARSVSPSPERHLSTRSLSLPRDNFIRGTPQRNTIGPIRTQAATPTIYEESEDVQMRHPKKKSLYAPIFKRGSLTGPMEESGPSHYPKRVSFTSSSEPLYWPTRNGPAPEPPTRQRKSTDSDVFFPDEYNTYANLPATMCAPNRPLPPIPAAAQRWQQQSESESGSEAGEVQRILQQGSQGRGSYFRFQEEEWGADGKQRGAPGTDQTASNVGRDDEVRRSGGGGGRSGRRDEPRRHTLSGDHHHHQQGGALARSMDLEMSSKSQRRKSPLPRGYPPPSSAMLFDDDPGIMSEVETSSTGFRRGGKQRSSLPVVRTPSKTLERPLGKTSASGAGVPIGVGPMLHHHQMVPPHHHGLSNKQSASSGGLVFLQYRSETKRALLPNEITSIDTVKALFVRSFPKQLTMEYLDSPHVKIYIHDSSKDMFYELEDLRSHLRDIRDRSVLRLFESTDMNGGVLPGAGVGVVAPPIWDQDQSYFSEPEFDSEYQHQHIHKSKASSKSGSSGGVPPQAPYYMTHSYPPAGATGTPGASATLPRSGPLLRAYSPAVAAPVPADRIKTLPQTGDLDLLYNSDRLHAESGYMSSPERGGPRAYPAAYPPGGPPYEDPYYSQYASRSGSITPVIDEEASDTELIDEYSRYGVKLPTAGRSVVTPTPRGQFPAPAVVPYDATRIRVEHMERQLANLTGLVQKALTQTPTPREYLQVPPPASARDANYRNAATDEYDKHSSSSSASLPDDSYLRTDIKPPKLGKDKSVSFEKSVSFSDEPPDMNSPKQHSPQHAADSKPPKPAIKSSTLPRMSSQERTERDRHKPAPPPKPVSLSPGQYEGRNVYRDLQLTPEMYNQLRGLQKKAKDLRQEVRNLRRMSQAQAHSVRETIRDTFLKIRAMLLIGGEEAWSVSGDADKVRLNREEDAYKQEMLRLEKDLTELESTVEELRGNVINRKTRVNMSDVENMALILSKSSKTVADLKVRFPGLQEGMKGLLSSEMEKVVREEKFLKEEPERLESALRRCKKLTGTLVTLKRLASVQEQRLPPSGASTDSRLSPTLGIGGDSDTPITPPAHGKPGAIPARGVMAPTIGSDSSISRQRPENALDALLDELQTFARPPSRGHNPPMADIGRKGSIDSAHTLPPSTGTSSLRRLHSYPSSSDGGGNSPPTVALARLQVSGSTGADAPKSPATSPKPPVPERNSELLSQLAGRRVPPPPPPRTSSRSPLASPTSPSLPPRGQHPPSQPQMGVGGGTLLRRGGPGRSSLREPLRAPATAKPEESSQSQPGFNPASNSSSCESINSQEGLQNKGTGSAGNSTPTTATGVGNKARQEILEQRHQELLRKQRALQEQYARLQQLQRGGGGGLAVVPPPDLLLKKTGSESNLLAKMGLSHSLSAAAPISGSLTHLAVVANQQPLAPLTAPSATATTTTTTTTTTTNKIYETDIL